MPRIFRFVIWSCVLSMVALSWAEAADEAKKGPEKKGPEAKRSDVKPADKGADQATEAKKPDEQKRPAEAKKPEEGKKPAEAKKGDEDKKPAAAPKKNPREYVSGKKWKEPVVITPGAEPGAPPSDAIILFDG